MTKLAIVLLLPALTGCAASFTAPDCRGNGIQCVEWRVTEYGVGGGLLGKFTGAIGGCRVVEAGEIKSHAIYTGETCRVEVNVP